MDHEELVSLKPLPPEGSLEQTPFAAILAGIFRHKATGCLFVQSEQGENRLYCKNGFPVGAQLAEGVHFLGRVLVEMGFIDEEQNNYSLELMMKTGALQGTLLVKEGMIDEETLELGLLYQLRRKVNHFFTFKKGAFRFEQGSGRPEAIPSEVSLVMVHPLWSIHNGLLNAMREAEADAMLAPLRGVTIKTTGGLANFEEAFGFSKEEQTAIERLGIWRPIEDFVTNSGLSRAEAKILLCALALTGMLAVSAAADVDMDVEVEFSNAGAPEWGEESSSPVGPGEALRQSPESCGQPQVKGTAPEEIALLREAINEKHRSLEKGSFFSILEVSEDAEPEAVKRAYLLIAKLFHPDSLAGTGVDVELSDKLQDILAVAHAAFETLSDPKKRSEYVEKLKAGQQPQKPAVDPREAEIAFHRGRTYMTRGDFAWAERFFKKALDYSDGDARFLAHYGWAIYRNPQREKPQAKEESIKHLKDAIAKDPNDGMTHHFLSQIYRAEGDFKMAGHHERLSKRIAAFADISPLPDQPQQKKPKESAGPKAIFKKLLKGLKKK